MYVCMYVRKYVRNTYINVCVCVYIYIQFATFDVYKRLAGCTTASNILIYNTHVQFAAFHV